MNISNLNSFLRFGYFLDYDSPFKNLIKLKPEDYSKYNNLAEKDLLKIGFDLWNNCIHSQIDSNQNVVPLSGGIDSRAILGSLLEFTDASNIKTYTFGSPGTYDYEIGNFIAKKTGTNHESFDLSKTYDVKVEELIDISNRTDNQTILFHHPSIWKLDKLYTGANIWSGTIIDVFFGRHNHEVESESVDQAMMNSFVENIYVKSVDLTFNDQQDYKCFVDIDLSAKKYHSYEHIIDLLNRQIKFIAPHVLVRGFNYKTVLHEDILTFANSLNKRELKDQNFYRKIFIENMKFLFKYPCKTTFGLPLGSMKFPQKIKQFSDKIERSLYYNFGKPFNDRNINYSDFNRNIRVSASFNKIIKESIFDLNRRNIIDWVNIEDIYNSHMNLKVNYADALIALASLEIHLKANPKMKQLF